MKSVKKAIETTATIGASQQLVLDEPLPIAGPARVKVIVFLPEDGDVEETEWLRAGSANPALAFLNAPEEDVYTLADGRPFHDKR